MSEQQENDAGKEEEKQESVKAEKAGKAGKAGKPKRVVLRVLKMADHVPATRWTAHVHRIMKEANPSLLKDPAVISAFNALIDVLLKHQEHIYGFGPCTAHKYDRGIHLDAYPENPLQEICEVRWKSVYYDTHTGRPVIRSKYSRPPGDSPKEEKEVREEVIQSYRVLFELIKGDVLPYMARMVSEHQKRENDKVVHRMIMRMEHLQMEHEKRVSYYHEVIASMEMKHEQHMNKYRDMIAGLSVEK